MKKFIINGEEYVETKCITKATHWLPNDDDDDTEYWLTNDEGTVSMVYIGLHGYYLVKTGELPVFYENKEIFDLTVEERRERFQMLVEDVNVY